jgi:hypothetical protein
MTGRGVPQSARSTDRRECGLEVGLATTGAVHRDALPAMFVLVAEQLYARRRRLESRELSLLPRLLMIAAR